jgi:predicted N-acetyltransferase YhbS
MKLRPFNPNDKNKVINLFSVVFSDSEGASEGRQIADLVSNMIETTEADDLYGFVASEQERIIAAVFFSRLSLSNSVSAFILSPMAVLTDRQRVGVGQKLIQHGIEFLRQQGVEVLFTYGDPDYYSKVGFKQISEEEVKAPCPLSYPHGWLAQSLTGQEMDLNGVTSSCVEALNMKALW